MIAEKTQLWSWPPVERAEPARRSGGFWRWLQLGVMVVVAVGLYWWLRHPFAAAVVGVLAGWLLLGLLGVPKLLVWFDRMGRGLSWLIGTGLTWLLLAPFYLIFFGIGGLWLRLTGRDPMCRRRDPVAVTYWNERRSVPVREHFSRQF